MPAVALCASEFMAHNTENVKLLEKEGHFVFGSAEPADFCRCPFPLKADAVRWCTLKRYDAVTYK